MKRVLSFLLNVRLMPLVRRAAWLLLVLLLAGVAVWTTFNVLGSARYRSALAAMEAEGFSTQPHRIAPAPPPAGENAAPYYSAAFALYVQPEENAPWQDYPRKRMGDLGPKDRAAADAWLARNAEAFDLVRRAQKRPRCQFEREYDHGFSMLLPEVSKVISLSRAFGALAETQLLAGAPGAARESVKSMFALAGCLREDALIVSFLVGLHTVDEALEVVESAVTDATGEADLRAWQALLPPDTVFQGNLERAYRGETAMVSTMLSRPTAEERQFLGQSGNRLLWDLMRPLFRFDGAEYLLDMRRVILACRKPYLEAAVEFAAVDAKFRSESSWAPLRSMVMPSLTRALERQATVEARLIVVRAGLEAERARRASGAYPNTVPGTDPFSGKGLVYDPVQGRIASVRPKTPGSEDRPTEWKLRAKK